uniref:DUF4604 domain-containing protein n=1 Tax=Caenorhabditis tropicalis TaxID=1561998 RepID=A0A1I7T8F9_9PELO
MTICGRKARKHTSKPCIEPVHQPPSDPNYDETQDNVQTVELQEDPLANVRLLTPTLPGGCNDENAAKEAATRHTTNQFFPKLQIQNRRIVNKTSKEELKRMVDQMPPHPPQRYRTELREPALEKRNEKWKNSHVHWNDIGLVFIVRSHDACRSKDDAGGDTVDSLDSPSKEEQESTKVNSEMPMSDKNDERKKQMTPNRSKKKTPAAQSSKKSSKDRKPASNQKEKHSNDVEKPLGLTPKTPHYSGTTPTITTGPESLS